MVKAKTVATVVKDHGSIRIVNDDEGPGKEFRRKRCGKSWIQERPHSARGVCRETAEEMENIYMTQIVNREGYCSVYKISSILLIAQDIYTGEWG